MNCTMKRLNSEGFVGRQVGRQIAHHELSVTENHKNHIYYIYSTRYFSEVDAEVRQTEDRLRTPGWRGGEEGESEEEERKEKRYPVRRESSQEREGSSLETQSKTRITVRGGGLKVPRFFFPWNIFTEIRGRIVTHFRQLCQYIGQSEGNGVGG